MKNKQKIAFVGNLANNFYREAKALRSTDTVEVDLYFKPIPGDSTMMPESDEPALLNNYPHWINKYPGFRSPLWALALYFFGLDLPLRRINAHYIDIFNQYDACVFSSFDMCFIPFLTETTTFFRATGSDLTVFPLFSWRDIRALRRTTGFRLIEIFQSIRWYLQRRLYSESVKSASYVSTGIGLPYKHALTKLRISPAKCTHDFRLAIDTTVFNARATVRLHEMLGLDTSSFYIFFPSRMNMMTNKVLVESGDWKASDNALRGFRLFLDTLPASERQKVKLLIPDRTNSDDLLAAKQLVNQLMIDPNVIYIRGRASDALTRDEMIDLYSISSVVLDDFGAGWYGSIVIESLACGTPVITYVPEDMMNNVFPWHPIQIAQAPQQIADSLSKLYHNQPLLNELRSKSRRWVQEFHSHEAISRNFRRVMNRI